MTIIYYCIKLYPVAGIVFGVSSLDLAITFRRRGFSGWVFFMGLAMIFFLSIFAWLWFRGDKNADLWFQVVADWVHRR